MLTWITAIVIFGSILVIFGESLPQGRFWTIMRKTILFVPIVIIGTIMHIAGDFKNDRLGYVIVLMVVAFIGFGFYMGFKAGPSAPPDWNY